MKLWSSHSVRKQGYVLTRIISSLEMTIIQEYSIVVSVRWLLDNYSSDFLPEPVLPGEKIHEHLMYERQFLPEICFLEALTEGT